MDGFVDFLADTFMPMLMVLGIVLVAVMAAYVWRDPDFR